MEMGQDVLSYPYVAEEEGHYSYLDSNNQPFRFRKNDYVKYKFDVIKANN